MIHDLGEWSARISSNVLSNAVKHHNRIVHGEADDREHGGDEERINLDIEERAGNGKEANCDDHVMQESDKCCCSESNVLESVGHPKHDPERPEEDEEKRLLCQILADDWSNR